MNKVEYHQLLAVAIRAALKAGRAIMQVYDGIMEIEEKPDGTPITLADRNANDIICGLLSGSPYPIISEENSEVPFATRSGWPYCWIVDPLDGTREFISRNGEFTVNIALIHEAQPVLGVIHAPASGRTWFTGDQHSVFHIRDCTQPGDLSQIRCMEDVFQHAEELTKTAQQVSTAPVLMHSRSHLDRRTQALVNMLSEKERALVVRARGSSLKFCDLAAKTATWYPRYSTTCEWDTAAGHAILRAAGGEVFDLEKRQPLHYNKETLINPPFMAFSEKSEASSFFSEFSL
ncbi:MAG: 3'(2'),5'-bisphosphate nucleotidase CysQ [Bacteroidales bacterium]|nr:3'(2'),5'-bisphosphate nucleotidase CysQ [Bacteroidales bacterium]